MSKSHILFGSAALALALTAAMAGTSDARPRAYKSLHHAAVAAQDPALDVRNANAAARVEPASDGFINANQVYAYLDGSLFQVYTSIGKITDIALQPGETLAGTGPVAAGDTARWIIGDTESGAGDTRQVHILVKPAQARLSTNLVINTNRRTYHIELHASDSTYMAAVSWRYPQDELVALQKQAEAEKARVPVAQGVDPTQLNFGYKIDGSNVAWRPILAFDDGRQVFIEFPTSIGTTDLPPLFVIGPNGAAELVNYRVKDNFFVVDRLFDAAELRLGDKYSQKVVRIKHVGGARS